MKTDIMAFALKMCFFQRKKQRQWLCVHFILYDEHLIFDKCFIYDKSLYYNK